MTTLYMIEDRMSLARCYSEFLKSEEGAEIIVLDSGRRAFDLIGTLGEPSLFLLDLQIADVDGFELLDAIIAKSPKSAVVVITSTGSFEVSRRVMEAGAVDYLEKPFTRDRLCVTMRNALNQLELKKVAQPFSKGFGGFIGSSIAMQGVYRIIESAAASMRASVFITGESGTGKEVCSQAIHNLSGRSEYECVILNCAAIPRDLMESEIFGHVKGAFTGATTSRDGAARRAHKGTLFLDEIGEMDLELQSKLLRFTQTGQFQRVGSSETETVDVRFVCATNRDPLKEVMEGRFREDLYYRLNVIPIELPPLRARGEDILQIAEHFLRQFAEEEGKKFKKLSSETKDIFLHYSWPGNVRQLLNVVRNIVVLHSGDTVDVSMLPAPFNGAASNDSASTQTISNNAPLITTANSKIETLEDIKPLWLVEMETIDKAVELCEGNVTKAAKLLDISPSTIYRKKPYWKKNLAEYGYNYNHLHF
jgi:two-component system, repressor protein LuxO